MLEQYCQKLPKFNAKSTFERLKSLARSKSSKNRKIFKIMAAAPPFFAKIRQLPTSKPFFGETNDFNEILSLKLAENMGMKFTLPKFQRLTRKKSPDHSNCIRCPE